MEQRVSLFPAPSKLSLDWAPHKLPLLAHSSGRGRMGGEPEDPLPPDRRAEIEAAAEATAHVVHRFLKEVQHSVEKLHRDLYGISHGAVAGWALGVRSSGPRPGGGLASRAVH